MTARVRSWLLGGVALLGAAAVSVVLYRSTRTADVGDRAEVTSSIRELQRWSALVSRETLAARYGLVPFYDSLTNASGQLSRTSDRLNDELQHAVRSHADISKDLAEVDRAILDRQKDVERFKSENSILRNSLYYLPLAARELVQKLGAEPTPQTPDIARAVNGVVEATLVYNLIRSDAGRAQSAANLATLEALRPSVPDPSKPDFDLFLLHARTVLRQHDVVNPLTARVIGSPVDARLGELERDYVAAVEASLARADRYRAFLYVWSVLLLAALVGAAYKLRQVYANLEQLVRDRTRKLDRALSELWGEMELAKRIQTALVPPVPSLQGCDVAATMRPAAEVGGDYYDVLEVDGVEWVLIGDVSGHGVPAGLVMMMFQTAVRTALEQDPRLEPNELLALVNRTLTTNVRRLGEDKYMTVSALRKTEHGGFRYSGLHQDLFVYRAKEDRVESLPTEGTWLGIDEDIGDLMTVRSFELAPGDSVLLYTDGLTESTKEGAILDDAGLKGIFQRHAADGGATEILKGVLSVLDGRVVNDDVSAIVVKRL